MKKLPLKLEGMVFGRATVLRRYPENSIHKKTQWVCLCECGREFVAIGSALRSGNTKSCGCLHDEIAAQNCIEHLTTHGHSRRGKWSREYHAWASMKARCRNSKNKAFCNYGGRGIKVCRVWRDDFPKFLKDMGKCPEGYEIDRIDNNRGYSKRNCRWASTTTQNRNMRTTKLSMEKAEAIRNDSRPNPVIARDYGVATTTIWKVKHNQRWKKEVR